jgi:hypothetical protein
MRDVVLRTARYRAVERIQESGLLPVGISVGVPSVPYELAGVIGPLAPHGLRELVGRETFEQAYLRRLDSFGAEAIAQLFSAFVDASGADGLVLLCFEDLREPGSWCHRRTFAAWWEERTGVQTPDLEPELARLI